MTAEMLSILAGRLLALLFADLPGLYGWYNRLGDPEAGSPIDGGTRKRLVMLACLALTSAAERLAVDNDHKMTVTLATPGWMDHDYAFLLVLTVDAAAGMVFSLYEARANFELAL